MKKVFAILATTAFVSFTACNNAPKSEGCTVIVEETIIEEENGEETEECIDAPSK